MSKLTIILFIFLIVIMNVCGFLVFTHNFLMNYFFGMMTGLFLGLVFIVVRAVRRIERNKNGGEYGI